MFIFSNNKYFAILLGRLELHALSPLDTPLVRHNNYHILATNINPVTAPLPGLRLSKHLS